MAKAMGSGLDALPLVKSEDFPACRQPAFNLMSESADIAGRM
jgi:hypothetical protein